MRSSGSPVSTVLSLTASALSAGLGLWLWQQADAALRGASFAAFAISVLAVTSVFLRRPSAVPTPQLPAPSPAPEATRPAPPVPTAPIPAQPAPPCFDPILIADGGALRLLAKLQEQGRLLDFAMEDIRTVPDAQVAAVARVVHTGCRAALQSAFTLQPLHSTEEGAAVTLAPGFDPEAYRLLGRVAGEPPFTGKLLHRGWRNTAAVKLPHASDPTQAHSGIVAPAEIELR